jgi:putative restriction endonuclease
VYFSHQPSGGRSPGGVPGRGEYEIAGTAGNLTAADLDGCGIRLDLGDLGIKETGLIVSHQGGKRRVRSTSSEPMIQRQVGSILMLPKSNRDRQKGSNGRPIILYNRYTVDQIHFKIALLSGGMVTVVPQRVVLTSSAVEGPNAITETINFSSRLAQVVKVEEAYANFPSGVSKGLQQHAAALQAESIGTQAERAIRSLASAANDELPQVYIPGTDVLQALEAYLGSSPPVIENPPEVPDDEIELKRRFAAEMRMQKSRGPSGAKFRKLVQETYDNRCVFCGLHLPKNDVLDLPGVDAAHILPWAKYDLDVIQNGLLLCKLHHWAFDQQVLVLKYSDDNYWVVMPDRVRDALDKTTLEELTRNLGPVPPERLPTEPSKRPSVQFLEELYAAVPPDED